MSGKRFFVYAGKAGAAEGCYEQQAEYRAGRHSYERGIALQTAPQHAPKRKNPTAIWAAGFAWGSLTMTYFHARVCTIIGAISFHGPVRDGKGWVQDAMVVRL